MTLDPRQTDPRTTDPAWPGPAAAPPPPAAPARRRGLRVFQLIAAASGAVLFVTGLVAAFRVDYDAGFLDTSGVVMDLGFSPLAALLAIALGAGTLVASLADEDRGGTAGLGVLTIVAGIVLLILDDTGTGTTDCGSALLFIVVGTIAFVAALIPWWGARRTARWTA